MAFSTASAGVRNVSTDSTGPKISSRAMRLAGETPVKIVGGEPEAALGQLARRRPAGDALGVAGVGQLADAGQLGRGVDRADVGVLVERIAQAQRGQPPLQRVDHLVGDRFLDEQPRTGAADVALVEEDAVDDALDGLVERRVLEDDVGRLAAQFERQPLAGAGRRRAG